MTRYIPFFKGALGLNMRDAPSRMLSSRETGLVELSEAVNIDVTNSRRISRRPGRKTTPITLPSHSLYSALGVTLFVSDDTLYRIAPGPTATVVHTGLSPGLRMRYTHVLDQIYFANGVDKGIYHVNTQAVTPWIAGAYHGPRTHRRFEDPPAGQILEYWQARIYIADYNILWFTEPHGYNWVDYSQNAYVFPAPITMIRGVTGGLWVATLYNLYFLAGSAAGNLQQQQTAAYGVIKGTDVAINAEDLDSQQFAEGGISGDGVICTAQEGICFCGANGTFRNLTKQQIYYPRMDHGTAYVYRGKYVVILE